ncbi:MAG TPA: hypothetical protein VGM64_11960 [Lacunisphaera sp.]|jgi:hypothetical protein
MQIPGETFNFEPAAHSSWIGVMERAGFTVEDYSHKLTAAGRKLGYEFSGRLMHCGSPGKVYLVHVQRHGTGFALRIESDKADAKARLEANAFIRKTLKKHFVQR